MLVLQTLFVLLLPYFLQGARLANLEVPTDEVPKLRVHAATFNAANKKYKDWKEEDYALLSETLLAGHEEPGNEADIVLLGFQEFEDDKYVMGNRLGESLLWKKQARAKMNELKKKAEDFSKAPDEINEVAETLTNEVKNKQQAIESKFTDHQKEFGKSGSEFHKGLADASPVNHLFTDAAPELKKMISGIEDRLEAYTKATAANHSQRYEKISAATENLSQAVTAFPNEAEFMSQLKPVRTWNKMVKKQMNKLRSDFPNLNVDKTGQTAWTGFLDQFRDTDKKEFFSQSKLGHQQFHHGVKQFQENIKKRIQQVEGDISSSLLREWKLISSEITNLKKDIYKLTHHEQARKRIMEAAAAVGEQEENTLNKIFKQWTTDANEETNNLRKMPMFPLKERHVNVRMEPQKYNSGPVCAAGAHFDTVLYAFVNPWSDWKITPTKYSSATCVARDQKSQLNMGCNIDNNLNGECGKVVNLQVFEVCKGDFCKKLCAMNTHMSFAGTAEHRLNLIGSAALETEVAGCQAMVFVGDFNSRLHCGSTGKQPPFAHPGDIYGSSLKYLLNRLCKTESPDTCSLKDSPTDRQKWDELVQILHEEDLQCYELVKSKGWGKKKKWELVTIKNSVSKMALQEPEMPKFPPTYKLVDLSKAMKQDPEWYHCNRKNPREVCYLNPTKKPKHNPAWTDRILVKAFQFETVEYSRRLISSSFGTDHAPVIARVNMLFDTSN